MTAIKSDPLPLNSKQVGQLSYVVPVILPPAGCHKYMPIKLGFSENIWHINAEIN